MGYFSKDFRFKFIHLNQSLNKKESTYTCAHELGHAVQHSDVSTPFGRATIGMLSVFAQLDREQIKECSLMGVLNVPKMVTGMAEDSCLLDMIMLMESLL